MKIKLKYILTPIICIVFIVVVCFSLYFFNTKKLKQDMDINNYKKYDYSQFYLREDFNIDLAVFPNEISGDYEYCSTEIKQGFRVMGYYTYLKITYANSDYNAELERLNSFNRSFEYNSVKGNGCFIYDDANKYFNKPAYIASYNELLNFEYALLLENYTILYVYVYNVDKEHLQLQNEFLPKNYFEINANNSFDNFSYSVYSAQSMWEYINKT